ncbi:MAG: hypothetical protein AAB447_01955 [Patescibacteria group bacterium]
MRITVPPPKHAPPRINVKQLFAGFIRYPTAKELAKIAKMLDAAEARHEKLEREAEAREARIKPRSVPVAEALRLARLIGGDLQPH